MKEKLFIVLALGLILGACSGKEKQEFSLSADFPHCPVGRDPSKPLPDVLRIEQYRITVSGGNIDEPMVFTVPGNAEGASVDDIPKGENRTLLVEALNNRDQVICRRELRGVSIKGGKLTPVEMSLLAVPFIANISDGNIVTQTRLVFRGYGEPSGAVEILDNFQGNEIVLTDLDTNSDLVSPTVSDADFTFRPAVLPIGEHTFTVRDTQTGETSEVTATLVRPGRQPGTGFSVAGFIGSTKSQTIGRNDYFVEALEALMK